MMQRSITNDSTTTAPAQILKGSAISAAGGGVQHSGEDGGSGVSSMTHIECCLIFDAASTATAALALGGGAGPNHQQQQDGDEDAELVSINVPSDELADLSVESFCMMLRQECTLEGLLSVLDSPLGPSLRAMFWSEDFKQWVRLKSLKGTIFVINKEDEARHVDQQEGGNKTKKMDFPYHSWRLTERPIKIKFVIPPGLATAGGVPPPQLVLTSASGGGHRTTSGDLTPSGSQSVMEQEASSISLNAQSLHSSSAAGGLSIGGVGDGGDSGVFQRHTTEIGMQGHMGMVRAPTGLMGGSGWGGGTYMQSPGTGGTVGGGGGGKGGGGGFPLQTFQPDEADHHHQQHQNTQQHQQFLKPEKKEVVPRPLGKSSRNTCFRVRIFLIRHGESEGNVNLDVYKTKPDHALDLTWRGRLQARQSGQYLRDYLKKQHGTKEGLGHHVRMWVSPYRRTRQTAEEILKVLNDVDGSADEVIDPAAVAPPGEKDDAADATGAATGAEARKKSMERSQTMSPGQAEAQQQQQQHKDPFAPKEYWVESVRESPFLAEQDFGSFEGHGGTKAKEQYREEFQRNLVKKDFQGQFWSRWPNGESCFDVCIRMAAIFSDITAGFMMTPEGRSPIRTVVVVSHGVTIRAFLASWCRYSPEWLAVSKNPNNCSINLIEDYNDRGCIFGGFYADTKKPNEPNLGQQDAVAGARVIDPHKEAWEQFLEPSSPFTA